ncbi:MAG: hypothetical protein IKA76_03145 [Clostridia bacterium]|nr:hypothetical protein [Clostridia bacterium]
MATDFYCGKRPYDYGEAMWVCESPDAWFIVGPEDDERLIFPEGEITVGDKAIKFTLSFGYGVTAHFTDENDNVILRGTCKYSPEKLIITVDKESDMLFDGRYDTITFVKKALDQERKETSTTEASKTKSASVACQG